MMLRAVTYALRKWCSHHSLPLPTITFTFPDTLAQFEAECAVRRDWDLLRDGIPDFKKANNSEYELDGVSIKLASEHR